MTYEENNNIIIKTYRQIRIICVKDILYGRSKGRFARIAIIEEKEEIGTRHSLKELETKMSEYFFLKCQRGLVVNMQHVKAFNLGSNELTLVTGESFKVSRSKLNLIREYFEKYS